MFSTLEEIAITKNLLLLSEYAFRLESLDFNSLRSIIEVLRSVRILLRHDAVPGHFADLVQNTG